MLVAVDADVALTRGADVRLTLLTATRRERPSAPATGLLGQSGIGRTGEGGSIQRRRTHRGVIFRIAEQAWGSRRALVLSTVVFVAAHLPGEISLMGVLVTAAASLAFSAAYQISRRLWLPMGMHFAWNYLFSAVFSVPVSGHEAEGWLHGSMSGPEWLSGGAYGVEASATALLVWALAAALLLRRAHGLGNFVPRLQHST